MKILTLFFVLMAWTSSANACTCDWSRNFLELCTESDVVIKFKAMGYDDYEDIGGKSIPLTLQVEVLAVYKGLISSVEMQFLGDNGMLCRKYADHFKIGRDYYFQYDYPLGDELPILDICGEYDLLSDHEGIEGDEWQENSTAKMSHEEFMDTLEEKLSDSASASYYPLANLNDGSARTYSDALLYSLFGVLILLIAFFVRVLNKSRRSAMA